MNTKKGKWMSLIVLLTTSAAAILGIFMIISSHASTYAMLSKEYENRLLEIGWSADHTVNSMMKRTSMELDHLILQVQPYEQTYLDAHDEEQFAARLNEMPMVKSEYASAVLLLQGNRVLLSSDGGTKHTYHFPNGVQFDRPVLCMDETDCLYVALIRECGRKNYAYSAIQDLEAFYRNVSAENTNSDYHLLLYQRAMGVYMINGHGGILIEQINPVQAGQRTDGVGILWKGESEDEKSVKATEFTRYRQADGGKAKTMIIASIPSSASINEYFAIGVIADQNTFLADLGDAFWGTALYTLLIVVAVFVLLLYVLLNFGKSSKIKKQANALQIQNETMQFMLEKQAELSHHQRLETIGAFTSGIAHEFNNLLTPIMGYSMMSMEKLPEGCDEIMDNLAEIYHASEKAKSLIARVSALSRKNNESAYRRFSPDSLMAKVREMSRISLPPNVYEVFDFRCPEECLWGNETQLGQLLLNLVLNSYHAMQKSGGTLTLSTMREGDSAVFMVADTGFGIPADVLPHIFDPFYTTKEMGHGTGLGLPIAKQIAEQHGGVITVTSRVGKGTTVKVTLPLRHENEENQNNTTNS